MAQCCYKTHREDHQTFPKSDAVSTSGGDILGIFQCYGGYNFTNTSQQLEHRKVRYTPNVNNILDSMPLQLHSNSNI